MAGIADVAPLAPGGPGRLRRVLGTALVAVGLAGVFVVALAGSVVVHLDFATTRRTARVLANVFFTDFFEGKLEVGEIDRLSLRGVTVRGAVAYDPGGAPIVHATGLRADADVLAIVAGALLGSGDIVIRIPRIHLENADVALQRGGDAVPTIAQTFLPRGPKRPPEPGGRKARVLLDHIEIDHVWAHGDVVPAPPGLDGEVRGVVGRLAVSPEGLTIDVEPSHLDVRAPLPSAAAGTATFRLRGAPGEDVRLEADFDGAVGALDAHATARMQGAHLAGKITIPHATGASITALLPGNPPIPLRVPVAAVIDADGTLPEIGFTTAISFADGGTIDATGKVALRSPVTVDAALLVHRVDPRVVLDVPSATPFDAKGHLLVEAGEDTVIEAGATTDAFTLAGNLIPGVVARAHFAQGVWTGSADVAEVGAPMKGTFSFSARDGLRFAVEAGVASLRAVRRLGLPMDGGGTVEVEGGLLHGVLDAQVKARADGVRGPGSVALASGGVDGRVQGPLDALQVDATAWGSGLHASYYSWEKVLAHVRGPLMAPRVDAALDGGDGESLTTSGQVDVKKQAVTGVKVQLRRHDGTIRGRVARVAAGAGGVKIEGLDVEGDGVGKLAGGLVVAGQEITGKLHGDNVDLEKVARLAGLPWHVAGLANVDVDLRSTRPGQRSGHVSVELVDGEAALLKGVSGLFSASFDGDRVRTDGLFRVVVAPSTAEQALGVAARFDVAAAFGVIADEPCDGAVARVRFTRGDGELPGPLLDPATWRKVTGAVELAADEWNLRCLRRLVPFGLPDVRGRLTTRATVERAPGVRLPSVRDFFAKTLGLEVDGSDWQSLNTDVEVRGAVDGDTGVTSAKVSLLDGALLGSASLSATLDLPLLLDQPERRWASLRRAPLSGRVSVPRNHVTAFAGLPSFVTDRVPLLTGKSGDTLLGEVELEATLKGTLDAPAADVRLDAWGLALASVQQTLGGRALQPVLGDWGVPVDVTAHAGYDGREAKLDELRVSIDETAVAGAAGKLALPFADLLAGNVHPTGSFSAHLDALPLDKIPALADADIRGHLSGTLAMEGIGTKPSLHLALDMPDAGVGAGAAYDHATVALDIKAPQPTAAGPRSTSKLRVAVSGPKSGALTTSVTHGVSWLGGAVPVLDPDFPGQLELTAHQFRIAAAAPFVAAVASRMDGVLDGEARIGWSDGKAGGAARFDGVHLTLARGALTLPQLGQELHDISFKIVGGGDGAVAVSDVQARGTKGLITGSGSAQFNGLVPRDAALAFTIKKGEELPITLEGVALGDASGEITLSGKALAHGWALKVGIPRLLLELSPSLGRSVISTDDNPDILVRDAFRPVEALDVRGRRISIVFDPVNVDVTGNIRGNTLDGSLVASKPIHVELGGKKPRVSGAINIVRGKLEMLHKPFEIEEGNLQLHPEDPDKIDVHVTARWDSPDGQIFIEYDGLLSPINPEKIKFRSPTIPEDRIIATLLGGADQATPAGTAQGTAAAIPGQSLATQLIAQQFSAQIAQNISTSIGTGDDGSIRPGLTYRHDNLSVDVSTYSNTRAQHSLGTVDWRFYRNWVLRGRVDVGSDTQTSGLDLLWQYRY